MQYFFADGDVQKGPFPIEGLRAQGLKPDSLVWREGMSQWQRADSVAELAWVIDAQPAVAPAPADPSPFVQGHAASPPYQAGYQPGPAYPTAGSSQAGAGYQPPLYYGGYASSPQSNGMAVASMILGILSIPMMFAYCLGTPCAVIAIVLGHIARGKARRGEGSGAGWRWRA